MSRSDALKFLREGIEAAKAGDKAAARRLLRGATGLDPANELAWLWLAGVAETPQETVAFLQRVLEINPASERGREGIKAARLQAGVAEARAGNHALARRYLQEATRDDPRNELAWLWLASVTAPPEEALGYFGQALAVNPASERARAGQLSARLRAAAQEARGGNRERARRYLLEALEQAPDNEAALLQLADLADSPAEALGHLEKVLQRNPQNAEARQRQAQWQARQAAEAPQWQCPICRAGADRELDRCPACESVLTLDDLDALLSREIRDPAPLREAIERLEAALRAGPDFLVHYHLGLAYANGKQLAAALRHFQAAQRLEPYYDDFRAQVAALAQYQQELESAEKARAAPARQPTILVVDDSPTVRKLVAMTMERKGYRVETAADGQGAVDYIRDRGLPDLIFLDITMPGMDGYQLCKFIRHSPGAKHVPVIMLSGKDGFFDKIRGRMAGSTAYITKPFKPEALVEAAEKYCPLASAQPV